MKRVTFSGDGNIELTLSIDLTDAVEGEKGLVRVDVNGVDVENIEGECLATKVYGWYAPAEAREIAKYLNEMADRAEAGEQA